MIRIGTPRCVAERASAIICYVKSPIWQAKPIVAGSNVIGVPVIVVPVFVSLRFMDAIRFVSKIVDEHQLELSTFTGTLCAAM